MPVGSNVDLGNILTIPGYSAGSLNADLVPSTDVSAYKWLGLYIGADTYVGTLNFQGSFDNGTTWLDITLYRLGNLDGAHSVSQIDNETTTLFGAPVRFPLFRCRMTAYTSGFATGTLELRSEGLAGLSLTGTNQAVGVLSGKYIIGLDASNGTHNLAITAGTVTDTVIYAGGQSMLSSVLVTTTGTNQATFYDNASAGSGTIIGLVAASAGVTGVPIPCKGYCANGITLKGNALNPAVTVFWTEINS
jgi:hypothetical protein